MSLGFKANFITVDVSPQSDHLGNFQTQFKGITTETEKVVAFPLKARIVILENKGVSVAIICLDSIFAGGNAVAALRSRISDVTDISHSNVLLCSSRSHSALSFGFPPHIEWTNWAMDILIESTQTAWQKRRAAKAGIGYGYTFEISYNRRLPYGENHTKFARNYMEGRTNPGPIDPRVGILRIEEISGELMGALVNFAAHPVTLIWDREITPDYPGFMSEYVETKRPESHIGFLQGACGNVNINHMFTTLGAAEYTGTLLGKEVNRILDDIHTSEDFPINVLSQNLSLPLQSIPTDNELDEWQRGCQEFLKDSAEDPAKLWVNDLNMTEYISAKTRRSMVQTLSDWSDWIKENRDQLSNIREIFYELTTLRLGELLVFFHPWELYVEIGLEIQRLSSVRHTWTVGYTNECKGYLPSTAEFKRGGYTCYSRRYFRDIGFPINLAEGSDKIYIEHCLAAGRQVMKLEK